MGIIYPDNEKRAKRVNQLITFIAAIQTSMIESVDRTDAKAVKARNDADKVLKQLGFKSFAEMEAYVLSRLTPEERKKYEDSIKEYEKFSEITSTISEASLVVAFTSGVVLKLSRPMIVILDTGALLAGLTLVFRGIKLLLTGNNTGFAMIAGGVRTFKALARGGQLSATASKAARVLRTVSTVLTVLGVILDGVILLISAIEGAKQKEELQKAINELFARRFMAKQVELQSKATEANAGLIDAYLLTYSILVPDGGEPSAGAKESLDKLLAKITEDLNASLSAITDDSVWGACARLDAAIGDAWTSEDPTFSWVMKFIADEAPVIPDEPTFAERLREKQQAVKKFIDAPNGDDHEAMEHILPPDFASKLRTSVGASSALNTYLQQLTQRMEVVEID